MDLEGFLGFDQNSSPFIEISENFLNIKLKYLEGSATPLFIVEVLAFQVVEVNCIRLEGLLLAKLNLLCLEMLIGFGFFLVFN